MGFLLDAMTQAKLDNQRDVVKNERRQSYENRPYGPASIRVKNCCTRRTTPTTGSRSAIRRT